MPPASVKDEGAWKRAKKIVEDQHGGVKDKYALVMHIYQQITGKKGKKMDKSDNPLEQFADEVLTKAHDPLGMALVEACVRQCIQDKYDAKMYATKHSDEAMPPYKDDDVVSNAYAKHVVDKVIIRMVGYGSDAEKSPKHKALKAYLKEYKIEGLTALVKRELKAYNDSMPNDGGFNPNGMPIASMERASY